MFPDYRKVAATVQRTPAYPVPETRCTFCHLVHQGVSCSSNILCSKESWVVLHCHLSSLFILEPFFTIALIFMILSFVKIIGQSFYRTSLALAYLFFFSRLEYGNIFLSGILQICSLFIIPY